MTWRNAYGLTPTVGNVFQNYVRQVLTNPVHRILLMRTLFKKHSFLWLMIHVKLFFKPKVTRPHMIKALLFSWNCPFKTSISYRNLERAHSYSICKELNKFYFPIKDFIRNPNQMQNPLSCYLMGSLKFPVLNFISLRNLHVRVCKIYISYYVCSICTVIYVYIFLREVLYIKSPNSCRSLTRPGIL